MENPFALGMFPSIDKQEAMAHQHTVGAPTLAQRNRECLMPSNAGSDSRPAHEAGVDMSLIEDSLSLTPEERLAERQQVLHFRVKARAAGPAYGSE